MGSRRQLIDLTMISLFSMFFNHLLVSYFIGAIFSLIFESPFLVLQNYLLNYVMNRGDKPSDDKRNAEQSVVLLHMRDVRINK